MVVIGIVSPKHIVVSAGKAMTTLANSKMLKRNKVVSQAQFVSFDKTPTTPLSKLQLSKEKSASKFMLLPIDNGPLIFTESITVPVASPTELAQ